jgi:enoyl-CoA hydratase/carnithine racemase
LSLTVAVTVPPNNRLTSPIRRVQPTVTPARQRCVEFSVEDSLRLGLIDWIAERDVLSEALALAEELAKRAPLSISGNKAILNAIGSGVVGAQADELQRMIDAAFESRDYIEGRRAFNERRVPLFQGA